MNQPILVIMAAGMGSRYGGLKQLDSMGPNGETMIDYSMIDAYNAGFRRLIFIIRKEFHEEFEQKISHKYREKFDIQYAFQAVETIPSKLEVPKLREKPWGTAHAIWSAKPLIDDAFAVINADDYYGKEAYQVIFNYLLNMKDSEHYAMVGYQLQHTLSSQGTVSRGLCQINEQRQLIEINEVAHIESYSNGIHFSHDGENWQDVAPETIVSMNIWGFPADFPMVIEAMFQSFLEECLAHNPLKGEFYLPNVVKEQLSKGNIMVDVLITDAQWLGITYQEDKPNVQAQLLKVHR